MHDIDIVDAALIKHRFPPHKMQVNQGGGGGVFQIEPNDSVWRSLTVLAVQDGRDDTFCVDFLKNNSVTKAVQYLTSRTA